MVTFTVDWETWDSFKPWKEWKNQDLILEPTIYLLDLLRRHEIKAIFYVVGWLQDKHPTFVMDMEREGHIIGDHTYYHSMKSLLGMNGGKPFRAPRWKGEKRLYSGGFWFRAMPYKWIKKEVEKTNVLFLHPHDVLFEHPDCGNPIKTFERRLGLKNARDKLERLCREIQFDDPGSFLGQSSKDV